jgi:MFS family permease
MTGETTAYDVRRAVWATRFVFAANGGLFATWVSRIPAIRDELGASERGLGFALLFTAVGSLVAMPLSARMISGFGARRVMAACIVVCCLAYPALGIAPDLVVLSLVLLVLGAGVGVWDVAMNVSAHAVEVRAGRILMPGFHAGWSIGTVAGAGVGALAAKAGLDPAVHFALCSVVVGLATVGFLQWMPDQAADEHDATDDTDAAGERHVPVRRALIRDRRLIGLGVMTFCAAWAEGAANDWLALMLTDDRAASGALAALGFAVFAAAMTLGRVAGNGVVNSFGRVRTLRVGAVVTAAGVALLLTVPVLTVSYIGALMWGLGIAVAFPLAMSSAGETPGRGPGAIAMVATIAYAGFLIGPPLIGTVAHGVGLDRALWVVVALAAGIFALAGTTRNPRGTSTRKPVQG